MRIIDFFSYKVLGLFDAGTRARDINSWSPFYKLSYLLNLSTIQTLKEESGLFQDSRSFTAMIITIKNPLIKLIPRPDFSDFLIADLGVITISNKNDISNNRGGEVWLDIYNILMKNFNITSLNQKVSDDFNISLTFERPVLTKAQMTNPLIDKSYVIKGYSDEIKFTFSQHDFRTMLKLFDLNFSYDDQLEEYINPECAPPLKLIDVPDHGGVFIDLEIEIRSLSILLNHQTDKIAEIIGLRTNILMKKYNDFAMDLKFVCSIFLGLIDKDKVTPNDRNQNRKSEEIFTIPEHCQNMLEGNRLANVLFGPLEEDMEMSPVERNPVFQLDLKNN